MNVDKAQEIFKNLPALAKDAASWLEDNAKTLGIEKEESELSVSCLRLANRSASALSVLGRRTTIGVFGASQAGKSYLVNTLSSGGNELCCNWGGEHIEFMTHINPSGGDKEATGAVTRFTHDFISTPQGFPVCIRILKTCEVAMILCNSFFNDFVISNETLQKLDARFEAETLQAFFDEIENDHSLQIDGAECGLNISPQDVILMADYVREHAKGVLGTFDAASPFWTKMRKLAPHLNASGLSKLFSLLWGSMEVLSALFEKLASELFKLHGAATVYTGIDAFVQKNADGKLMQYQNGTLLSIITLTLLFSDTRRINTAFYEKGALKTCEVGFAALAAALLELQFPLDQNSRLGNFDVLDFPGARARRSDSCEDFLKKGLNEETRDAASEFLRRGKVAYLFDRYSKDREVDVLLFCINSASQQEVSSLVTILNDWIAMNVGATAQERQISCDIPLIGVLTRFDQALEKDFEIMDKGQHSMGQNVMAAALEHFRNCNWLNEWSQGQPHKRFFLVRRPGLCSLYDRQGEHELSFKAEFEKKLAEFKQAFASDPNTAHLHTDATAALNEVLTPDDGGAGAILDLIEKEFSNYKKSRERICDEILKLTAREFSLLSVYQSGSGSKAAARAKERGLKLCRDFLQCDDMCSLFAKVRAYLEPDENEFESLYLNSFSYGRNAARYASECISYVEQKLHSLNQGGLFASLSSKLNKTWEQESFTRIKAATETEALRQSCSFFKNDEEGEPFLKAGDPRIEKRFAAMLGTYAEEIVKSVQGADLESSLRTALEENEQAIDNPSVLAAVQSRVARQKICEFLLFLGFDTKDKTCDLPRSFIDQSLKDHYPLFSCHTPCTKEPINSHEFVETLPNLDDEYRKNCGYLLLLEHLTALLNLMVTVNLNVQGRYKLNALQSDELERLTGGFEQALKQGA